MLNKLLVLLSLSMPVAAFAQTTSWIGASSTSWNNSANWTAGVPGASTSAIIGDTNFTGSNQPQLSGTSSCKSLTLGNGTKASTLTVGKTLTVHGDVMVGTNGTISHSANVSLTVQGSWTNNGTYTASANNATVVLGGTSQTLAGTSATPFKNLTINSGSATTLKDNITVSKALAVNGTLDPSESPTYTVSGTGTLTVGSGGVLKVKASTFAGNYLLSGTVSLNASSEVDYAAASTAQTVSSTYTYGTLRLNGGSTKSLSANLPALASSSATAGNIYIDAGVFDLSSFTANRGTTTAGGTISILGGATLRIGGSGTFPANFATHSMPTAATVEYYGTNQTVSAETYGNLILSSSGTSTKTMPSSAFTVAGTFSSVTNATGASVSYTASANITFNAAVIIGAGTTFNGGSYFHSVSGSWTNNGIFAGGSSTILMNAVNGVLTGSGTQNFYNVTMAHSTTVSPDVSIVVAGSLATTNAGTFTHTSGSTGTVTMTGSGQTISGTGIIFNHLTISGSITTTDSFTIYGNLDVDGSFTANGGTLTLAGTGKSFYGAGSIAFSGLNISGSITTTNNHSLAGNCSVSGSFTATAGTLTVTGTTLFSGTASLYNVTLNGTLGRLAAGSVVRIAGSASVIAGTFDPTTLTPNTIVYNGANPQYVVPISYNNLEIASGAYKFAVGNINVSGNFTIDSGAVFNGGSGIFTNYVQGNWQNSGTFNASTSTVELTGPGDATLSGSNNFNCLRVNKSDSSVKVALTTNQSVGTLDVVSGWMNTDTNSITITNARTGNGIILGTITRTHAFNAGTAYAFEGPNNTITFNSLNTVSSVTVTATSGPVTDFPFGGSINRLYTISLNSTGNYNATLRLHYDKSELNGDVESNLQLWDTTNTTWVVSGKTSADTNAQWVEQSGLTNVTARWTLSDDNNVVEWNGSVSSDWGNSANWTVLQGSPSTPPSTNDIVRVGTATFANQPTITSAAKAGSLTFGSQKAVSLTLSTGGSLTVAGNVSGMWANDATNSINVGAQTVTIGGDFSMSDGTNNHVINMTASSGVMTVNGSVANNGNTQCGFTFTGDPTLNVGGNFQCASNTFVAGNSTVIYNGSGGQTVAPLTYNNLVFGKTGGTAVLSSPASVAGSLTVTNAGTVTANASITVVNDVVIGGGATFQMSGASSTLSVAGNWTNNGTFIPGSSTILFNGSGAQSISTSTFNNIIVAKPSGTVTLTGDLTINGDWTLVSGILDLSTHAATHSSFGGTFTLNSGTSLKIGATFPSNFAARNLASDSTVEYNSSTAQAVSGETYGNLIFSNGGSNAKTLGAATLIAGNLMINSNAVFTDTTYLIELQGNWTNNGTFNPGTAAVKFEGTNSFVAGDTTFNDMTIVGTCSLVCSNVYIHGNLIITGTFIGGATTIILDGDFTNAGSASSAGVLTFTGTRLQTIQILGAQVSASTGVVNFNGTVAPLFRSTSSSQLLNVNVNNTGGIAPVQNLTVFGLITIATNSALYCGSLTHTFFGSVLNYGTITSSGTLNFLPATNQTILLCGVSFSSTGTVKFGGAGQITLSNNASSFNNVIVANMHSAGVTPNAGLTLSGDLNVNNGATFHAGAFTHTIGGNVSADGTFDGQTSSVILNGTSSVAGVGMTFNNLIVSGTATIAADLGISGNFTNNGTFDSTGVDLNFLGANAATIAGSTTPTPIDLLVIAKTSSTVTLGVNVSNLSGLTISTGTLDAATFTLSESTGGLLTIDPAATLKIGGTNSLPTFDTYNFDPAGTVEYSGSSAQVITAQNYGSLKSSSTGARTLPNGATVGVTGTFTPGSNTYTNTGSTINYNGSGAQTIAAFNYNNLTSSSTGTCTLSTNGTIGVAGTFTPNANTTAPTNSTMNFNGAAQTIPTFTYGNLTTSGSGAKTLGGNITVAGKFSALAGSLADGGFIATVNGDVDNEVSYSGTGEILLSGGSTNHVLSGVGNYSKLELNDANNALLSLTNLNATNLVLTAGYITTTTNKVILPSTGSVVRTNGWINGNFQKNFPTGANVARTFEIGTTNGYNPASITFSNVTVAGNLTASAATGDHPSIASSILMTNHSANVYWTLTNASLSYNAYNATFQFNNPADLDAGVNPTNLIIGKFLTNTWSYFQNNGVNLSRTTTNTTAYNITSLGDFELAESTNHPPTISTMATLVGALENAPFTISFSMLSTNSNIADPDGDFAFFRIESVTSGTLTKNGSAIVPGVTTVNTGENLVWTPTTNSIGTFAAFTVRAYDGTAVSTNTVTVNVAVSAVSGNWNVDASGNWSTAANWTSNPGVPGNTAGDTVGLTYNISAPTTVTIDSISRTVGTLNIGDSGSSYFPFTLAASGGAGLSFANNGSTAALVQATTTAADVISAPLTLVDNLSINNNSSLTLSGGISGSKNLTKTGAGTLIISGINSYGGNTTVSAGTLQLSGGNNLLPTGTTLNLAGATFDLQNNNQTIATITLTDNTTNTITGSGGTLTVNTGDLVLASSNINVTNSLSMSNLSNFTYNAPTNAFKLSPVSYAALGLSSSTVSLATNNSITATNFYVAGTGGAEPGFSAFLHLGQSNLINANSLIIGYVKQSASVDFRGDLSGTPSVTLRAPDGTSATTMNVGQQNMYGLPNSTNTATFDTTAGSLDALLSTLTIGKAIDRYGTLTALFKMGAGTLSVTNMVVGQAVGTTVGSSFVRTGTGTFELAGGNVNANTVTLGDNTSTAGTGTATAIGNLKVDSGTLRAAIIQKGSSSGGTSTATFTWYDGTVGNLTGSDMSIFGVNVDLSNTSNTSGTHAFDITGTNNASTGSAVAVTGINCSMTKTGTGTLTLKGTNTYSGNTTISAGTLALGSNGSISNSTNISIVAGATYDVSAISAYTLSANTALNASGTGTAIGTSAATLKGGTAVNFGSQPITLTYDGSHPALYVSQGTLSLNGNAFTVNSAAPLAAGSYTIIQQASGNITGSGPFTVTGTCIGSGKTASVTISGGTVILSLTNITTTTVTRTVGASPSTYGSSLTFHAVVSPDPGDGSVITFMTNGVAMGTATTTSGAADFTTSTLPYSGGSTYTVTASFGGNALNLPSSGTLSGGQQVNKATVSVTANNDGKTYGQTRTYGAGASAFTSSGLQNGETIGSVTLTASGGTTATAAVGSYTLTPSAPTGGTFNPANYTITYNTGTLSVNPAVLTVTASAQSKTYGQTLTFGSGSTSFTSSGLQNSETIGSVTLAVSGNGGAATAAAGNYTITPSAATGGTFNPGNYTITYYTGTLTVNAAALTITAIAQSKTYGQTVTSGSGSTLFTSSGLQNGETIGSVTLAVSGNGGEATAAAGSYTITPSAATGGTFTAANYTITYSTGTFTVNAASLTVTANAESKTYGQTLTFGSGSTLFTSSGLQNGDTIGSVTLAVSGNGGAATAAVGSYNITPSAATGGTFNVANYSIAYITGTLTVNPATLTGTADDKSRAYGQTNPVFTVTYSGFVNGEDFSIVTATLSGSTTATTNSPIGTYPITVSGQSAPNYTINYVQGVLTITSAALTINVDSTNRTYGVTNPIFTGSLVGIANNDNITATFTSSATTNSVVGAYSISPVLSDPDNKLTNYTVTTNLGTLTITTAPLIVTVNNANRTYGAANPSLTGSIGGLKNNDNITATYATTATTNSPVGSYTIVPTLSDPGAKLGNYTVTTNLGTLTVNAAALTVTASAQSKIYGQTLTFGSGSTQFTSSGLQNNETIGSVTLAVSGNGGAATAAAGSYAVTPSAATGGTFNPANYTITYSTGTLTVNPAALTVTASAQSKTYGQTLTFGSGSTLFTSSGLQNSETIGSVTLAVSGNGGAATAAAGAYTITPSAATGGTFNAANYTITYNTGTLTVNKAPLTVTASPQSKTYGQTLIFGSGSTQFTSSGLQNSETIGSVTLAVSSNGDAANAAVGSYTITPSAATGGTFNRANYTITYNTGTLTANAAALTVTASAQNKTYGQVLTFGSGSTQFTSSGLQNSETIGSVTLAVSGNGGSATAAVGTYTIAPSTATGGTFNPANYTITYSTGTLTVNAASLTVTANAQSKTYGQTLTFGSGSTLFTSSGLQNGETIGSVTLAVSSNGGAPTATVGSYTITPSAATGGTFNPANYTITYNTGTLTVNPASLTVTANSQTKIHGQTLTFGSGSTQFTSSGLQNNETIGSVTLAVSGNGGDASAPAGTYTITPSAATGGTFNASNYTITYNTGTLTVLAHGIASQLVIHAEPAPNAVAGAIFTNQPVVQIADSYGNLITEDNSSTVTAAIQTGSSTLHGTVTQQVAGGIATFTNLSYNVAENISLKFTSTGLTNAVSTTIFVSPAASAILSIDVEPSDTATAGQAFSTQPVIAILDGFGNLNTNDNASMVTVTQSGGADLLGTTNITAVHGIVAYTDLAETVATSITLNFTAAGLTGTNSTPIEVAAGALAHLSIVTRPSTNAIAMTTFAQQPVIALLDAYGNVITSDSETAVTATAVGGSNPLDGTTSVTAFNGVVTYTDLSPSAPGTIYIQFSAGAISVNSANITVVGGPATHIAFSQEPTLEQAGRPFKTQPIVQILDQNGFIAGTLPPSLPITISLPGTNGYLFGQTNIDAGANAGAGVATFTNLEINSAGDWTLTASASGFDDVTSDDFTTVGTVQPFTDVADYSVGATPNSMWVGNFRGATSARDLVVANHDARTLTIRLSDDNGAFGNPTTNNLPAHPIAVRAMDLNADGFDDLVVAYDDTNFVSVLLSTGSHGSQFAAPSNYAITTNNNPGVSAMFLSDLNGDGHPDLVVANSSLNNITVLYGYAGGGFVAITNLNVGANPQWVHVDDVNNDGVQDIVVANYGDGSVSILYGLGKTNFAPATTITPFPGGDPRPIRVTTPDVNLDGRPDLAIVNYASNTVSVLLQNSNGTFTVSSNYNVGTHPTDFFLRDLNGDGIPDMAVLNSGSGTVDLLFNSGAGSYQSACTIPVGPDPVSIFGGKFNQYMRMNGLVVADAASNTVSVLYYSVAFTHNATNNVNENQSASIKLVASNPAISNSYNYTITQYPTNGTLTGTPPNLTYTPNLDYIGRDIIKFTADANGSTSTVATVTLNVLPVNHAPSFTMATNRIVLPQGASLNFTNFVTSQSPGPANESDQKIDYVVSAGNPLLFSTQPKLATNGTLSFTLALNTNGTTTLTIYAHDNGGTDRGGTNISDSVVLTIVETPVDQPPVVKPISTVTMHEDVPTNVLITVTDVDDSISNLTVTPTSLNERIIPTANIVVSGPTTSSNFVVTLTSAPNANGGAAIQLAVSDGTLTTIATFNVNVIAVNDAPSFTIPNTVVSVLEDSPLTVISNFCTAMSAGPADETAQTLTFVLKNTNTAAFSTQPSIDRFGTLRFRPAPNHSGTNYIAVRLKDGGTTLNGGVNESGPTMFCIAIATNNFRHLSGNYNGLFHESTAVNHNSSGFFSLTLGYTRTFSGKMLIEGGSYTMSGAFDTNGNAHTTVLRTGKLSLSVDLQLNLTNGDDEIAGQVTDGHWVATLLGDRQLPTAPTTIAGKYNAVFVGSGNGVTSPGGDAIGIATLTTLNRLTFSGFLPDKTTIYQSVPVSKNGQWPLYVPLYAGAGSMLGWVTITNDTQPVVGAVSLIKTNHTGYYPRGFTNEFTTVSSRSTNFLAGSPVVSTNGTITCSEANLTMPLVGNYAMTPNDIFLTDASTNHFKLTFDVTTGYLNGSFVNPVTKQSSTFKALLLPNANVVRGYFDTPTQTGEFVLQGN